MALLMPSEEPWNQVDENHILLLVIGDLIDI
jgi:hypothetical protein